MNAFWETLEGVCAVIGGVFVLTCIAVIVAGHCWPTAVNQIDDDEE